MTLVQTLLSQNGIQPKAEPAKPDGSDGQQANQDNPAGGGDGDDPGDKGGAAQANNNGGNDTSPGSGTNTDLDDDATIIAGLQKRGFDVKSLDELKPKTQDPVVLTAEQQAELDRKRKDNIRSFALQAGKVTSTKLDEYAIESAMPATDLAFTIFKRERLAELAEANTPNDQIPDDAALRAEFDEENFLYADENDPKRKRALKRLQKQTDGYLQENYSEVFEMESMFDENETTTTQRNNYQSLVNDSFTSLGTEATFTVKVDDKTNLPYKVKFSQKEIDKAVETYRAETMFNVFKGTELTKETMIEAIKSTLYQQNIHRIASDIATAHASAEVAAIKTGRRNIIETSQQGSDTKQRVVTPGVKAMLDRAGVKN